LDILHLAAPCRNVPVTFTLDRMKTVRWLLVALLWIAGLCAWFIATIWLESVALGFCPEDLIISGTCAAEWYPAAETIARCLGAALGAAAAVGLPSLIAPRANREVALYSFGLGAALAVFLAYLLGSSATWPLVAALSAGVLAAVPFFRRHHAV